MQQATATISPSKVPATGREFLHYLSVLRKRWRLMVGVLILALTVALLFTIRQPKIYEATDSVIIDLLPPGVEPTPSVIESP